MNPIAIVTDSGTDVPEALCHRWDIHVLPLLVQYEAMTCRDRVDITVQQVLDRLDLEIPKTSMPTLGDAVALLESLRDQGYKEALAVTISSGLSGTCQMLRLAAEDIEGMDVRVVDSRSIGIGAGGGVDGQVLVVADMLGMTKGFSPKFLRRYADLNTVMTDAIGKYVADVKSCDFPNESEQY